MSTRTQGCASRYRPGVTGSEVSLVLHSRRERFDGTSPLILYCHGVNSTALEPQLYDDGLTLPQIVAEAGFIVISSLWDSATNWARAAAVTAMEGAVTWGQNNGAKSGPIGLWGVSMGFMTLANYWSAHPADVGKVFGAVPVCNASNVYSDNAGLQAGMDAAYGGSFATNGASRSPHLLLPDITGAGAKLRLHYSSSDAVIRAADVTALVAAVGATAADVEPATPSGHSSWSAPSNDEAAIVAHFATMR